MKAIRGHLTLAIAASLSLVSAQAAARSASQLSDLVGAKGGFAENELEARGFTHITSHSGDYDRLNSYWWNARDKNCVRVVTSDGRYSAIKDASKADCNQKDGSTGTALAAVAGVALIAALASHKSGHHDDGNHYANQGDEAQYERGFNDGQHNSPYHNYQRSDAYSSGYKAGIDQRGFNTNRHYGRGGYTSVGQFEDLSGARASSADSEMNSRGFRNVDSFKSANTAYSIWSRPDSHQCVQMTVADGSVYDIRDIGSHPKCR